ncbi:hypothetical protein IRJ41_003887 [Triplophysa rosa]|uniref:Uncharacterized protein n=1 Tax=Triplophysa rosa TaxID=992332 RepID=A0A9W8C8H2_TRIRA|nr:hypothetical protein IRJ41_003887 [Triplophysa rosa]
MDEEKRSGTRETMRGGREEERKREREMTCIGSEIRVQNDHISLKKGREGKGREENSEPVPNHSRWLPLNQWMRLGFRVQSCEELVFRREAFLSQQCLWLGFKVRWKSGEISGHGGLLV